MIPKPPTWQITRFPKLESTMHAAAGLPVGSVIVADEQSAGIGRHGHTWDSPPEAGLYVSIVLPPHPVLTLALGLAAQRAVHQVTTLQCDLRWPNDLMLAEKKLGGILVQVIDDHPVAGIGINLRQRRFPPELQRIATSLAMETGLEFSRDDLLNALLDEIPRAIALSPADVIQEWELSSTWARGKAVQVDVGSGTLSGVTHGLDSSGFLLIRTARGEVERVIAGGVRSL